MVTHIKNRRAGVRAGELAEAMGMPIRVVYRYLSLINETQPLYTESRGRMVFYKILRGDE
jgi:predicted DNA-binding transcriptional regulator YafY